MQLPPQQQQQQQQLRDASFTSHPPPPLRVPVCRVRSSLLDAHAPRTSFPPRASLHLHTLHPQPPSNSEIQYPKPLLPLTSPKVILPPVAWAAHMFRLTNAFLKTEDGHATRRIHDQYCRTGTLPANLPVTRHIAGSYMNVPITAYPNGGSQPPLAGDLLIYRREPHAVAHHKMLPRVLPMKCRIVICYLPPSPSGLHLVSALAMSRW